MSKERKKEERLAITYVMLTGLPFPKCWNNENYHDFTFANILEAAFVKFVY